MGELCHALGSCRLSSSFDWLSIPLELWTLLLTSLVALSFIQQAERQIRIERSRTVAEREAFSEFASRVANVSIAAPSPGNVAADSVVSMGTPAPSKPAIDEVGEAYRETVMSVSHFEEEYAEPMIENMAIELGDDLAGLVENGFQLSPMFKSMLITRARRAATERENFIEPLERESDHLRDARNTFDAIESALADLDGARRSMALREMPARWKQLQSSKERCGEVLERRQRQIHTEPMGSDPPFPVTTLIDYLYQPLPVDYPVLSDGSTVYENIQRAERMLMRETSVRR